MSSSATMWPLLLLVAVCQGLLLQPNGGLQYLEKHGKSLPAHLTASSLPFTYPSRQADKRLSYAFDRMQAGWYNLDPNVLSPRLVGNLETADECVQNEDCLGGQCVQDGAKGHRVCTCLRDSFRYSIANGLDVCLKCRNLSNSCSFDDECQCWDKHAECKSLPSQNKGHCRCRAAYVPVLNQTTADVTCTRRGGINSICETDTECQHISFLDAAGNPLPPYIIPVPRARIRLTTTTTTTSTTTTPAPVRVVPDTFSAICVPVIDVADAPVPDREELGQPILVATDEHADPLILPLTTTTKSVQRVLPDAEMVPVNDSSNAWDGEFMMSEGNDKASRPSLVLRTRLLFKRQVQAVEATPVEVPRSNAEPDAPNPMEKTCQCPDGFQMVPGNEYLCQDIDECNDLLPGSGLDPCNPLRVAHSASVCVNTPGSYRCECNATFAISNGMPPGGICCEDGYIPCLDATKCVPLENLCDSVPHCLMDCSDELYPFCNFNARRPFPDLSRYPQCHEPDLEMPDRVEPAPSPVPVAVPGRGSLSGDTQTTAKQEDKIPVSAAESAHSPIFSLPDSSDAPATAQVEGSETFPEGAALDAFDVEIKENVTSPPSTAKPVPVTTAVPHPEATFVTDSQTDPNDKHTLPPLTVINRPNKTIATPPTVTTVKLSTGNGKATTATTGTPIRTTRPTVFTTGTSAAVQSKNQSTTNNTVAIPPTKVTPCDKNTTSPSKAPASALSRPVLISPHHQVPPPPRRIQGNLQAALANALGAKIVPAKSGRPSPMVALANSLGDIGQLESSFAVVPVIADAATGAATAERETLRPLTMGRDEERPPSPLPTLPPNMTAALFLGYTMI